MDRVISQEILTAKIRTLTTCKICEELTLPREHKPKCCQMCHTAVFHSDCLRKYHKLNTIECP
jgi:hypothetical protein